MESGLTIWRECESVFLSFRYKKKIKVKNINKTKEKKNFFHLVLLCNGKKTHHIESPRYFSYSLVHSIELNRGEQSSEIV